MTLYAPSGPLDGTLRPPPDKSISHRAALIAAMGEGETTVESYLDAGASVVSTDDLYRDAEVVLRVQKPSESEIARVRQGQALIGLLSPLIDPQSAQASKLPVLDEQLVTRLEMQIDAAESQLPPLRNFIHIVFSGI